MVFVKVIRVLRLLNKIITQISYATLILPVCKIELILACKAFDLPVYSLMAGPNINTFNKVHFNVAFLNHFCYCFHILAQFNANHQLPRFVCNSLVHTFNGLILCSLCMLSYAIRLIEMQRVKLATI